MFRDDCDRNEIGKFAQEMDLGIYIYRTCISNLYVVHKGIKTTSIYFLLITKMI